MKYKKLLSAFLATAMTVATVLPGAGTIQAEAAEAPQPIKTFSFENDLDGSTAKTQANSGAYSGTITYDTGKSGQAVKLGDYGLQMNTGKIGNAYTISLWVNPTQNLVDNGSLIFMGAPKGASEYWSSVAGDGGGGNIKLWSNNGSDFAWKAAFTGVALAKDEWSLVTYTQSGNDAVLYINGEAKGSGGAAISLNQDNSDLYLGVTNWDADGLFNGLVDEVQVYNEALTADQVYALYDTTAPEDIFAEKGFTVNAELSVYTGRSAELDVVLPVGVAASDAQISYSSSDASVATVANGTVTGVKAGTATITTTVKVGDTTKNAETQVTVSDLDETEIPVVAKYEMNSGSGAAVADTSGNGFDATIVNPNGTSYEKDGDRSVLKINSADSYVTFPTSIYEKLTNKEQFTIQAKYARTTLNNAWLFCIGSKAQSTGTNYLFYAPFFGGNVPRAGIKDSSESLYNFANKSFSADTYYTVTMVFDNGTISIYVDGALVGSPLVTTKTMATIVANGTQNGVLGFIGKSCWSADPNYTGSVDEFTIYDAALTEDQVQLSDADVLQKKLEALDILGDKNESLDAVVYDLNLVKSADGFDIKWSSDNEDVITADGKVLNSDEDTQVTLTATASYGLLTAEAKYTVTVKALDLTLLKAVVAEAKEMQADVFEADSYQALQNALEGIDERVAAVKSQQEAADIEQEIRTAVSKLVYKEDYKDPWTKIEAAAPKEDAEYKPGESEALFTIPEGLENCVTVEYSSDNEEVATYADGKVTAVKAGTAILTTTVTAKYDGWKMEYGTYVTVKGEEPSVTSITVKTAPEKTEYKIGEELDLSGIVIEAAYDDGTKKEIDIKDCTVTGFDNTKAGTQKVTVTYEDQTVTFEVTVSTKAVSDIFDDVDSEDWFNDYVQNVYDKEIMTGLTPTHFGPTDTLARAQFALMLYRMEGEPEVTTTTAAFPDAGESWYKDAVIWANQNKIITGYTDSGLFGPADPITREQMATIMYRYANYKKWDVTKSADLSTFPDASSVSAYAKDAMAWAVANEIIQGNNGRLDPQGSAVRAQAATIISRFIAIYPVFE